MLVLSTLLVPFLPRPLPCRGDAGTHQPHASLSAPTECRELLLQTTVPILQDLIEKGEEEDACIELLSNILEVLYKAQKVNPIFSAASFPLSSNHLGNDLTKPV